MLNNFLHVLRRILGPAWYKMFFPRPRQTQSRLLTLPPELRNKIYEYVLDDKVSVSTSGYHHPALLQTCGEMRDDALKMFYFSTTFEFDVSTLDSDAFCYWKQHMQAIGVPAGTEKLDYRIRWKGRLQPNWANLYKWLERLHADYVDDMVCSPSTLQQRGITKPEWLVIAGLMMQVHRSEHRPWTEVKQVVEGQRPILVALDARWAN